MNLKYTINTKVYNRTEDAFVIKDIHYDGKYPRYTVESVKTGFTTNISRSSLYSGKYKDKLRSYNKNGGIIGYAHTNKENTKYYYLWEAMLSRCNDKTSDSYVYYGQTGVRVCKRWHRFDLFLADITKIQGFDEDKFHNNEIELDKDFYGKKLYSPSTCIFLTPKENNNITKRHRLFQYITPCGEEGIHNNKKYIATKFNLDDSAVCKALNHQNKTIKGYTFQYIDANDYQKG